MNTKYFPVVSGLTALVLLVALLVVAVGQIAATNLGAEKRAIALRMQQRSSISPNITNNAVSQMVSLPDMVEGIVKVK